ncbi:hypothetical protein ACWF62_14240 [Rhodococcus sp. NPDC054953]
MPGYVLDGAGRVDLPRRTLAVTVDAVGSPVQVRALADDGTALAAAVYPREGFMVLPRIEATTMVAARPGDTGEPFPEGTILHVVIGEDSALRADPERAELTPIDVSGLHHVELATIRPAGDRLEVTARKTAADVPLGELAMRARSAARGALRLDRLPPRLQVSVELDIDTTYSMLPRIDDGSIRAMVEIVAGITTVIGAGESLRVNLIGRTVTTLPSCELRDVADRVQAALDVASLGVGFRPASVDRTDAGGSHQVFCVTDLPPADRTEARVVVLSPACEEAAPGVTVVAEMLGVGDPSSMLLATPTELSRIVKSLLSDIVAQQDAEGVTR